MEVSYPVRVPPGSPNLVAPATVRSLLPCHNTPLMLLGVYKVLAVLALTLSAAAMVPAEKLSLASLATVALAVLALTAVVAELDTFPVSDIVASIALGMLPASPVVISVPLAFGSV